MAIIYLVYTKRVGKLNTICMGTRNVCYRRTSLQRDNGFNTWYESANGLGYWILYISYDWGDNISSKPHGSRLLVLKIEEEVVLKQLNNNMDEREICEVSATDEITLKKIKDSMYDEDIINRLSQTFKVLADPKA